MSDHTEKKITLKEWEALTLLISDTSSIKHALARVEGKLDGLAAYIGAAERADRKRDDEVMATVQEVLDKARQAQSVSASTNIAVKEAIRLLKLGQADPADAQKLTDAAAILDGIIADDSSVLTENTEAEGESAPEGNT